MPGRLWVRARTNSLSLNAKRRLRDELKLTDVVCCCLIRDEDWYDIGTHYIQFPWSDSTRHIPDDLDIATGMVCEAIEQHSARVLIYCDSGRNRSCLLAAMVVRRILGVSGSYAMGYVRGSRPMALKNPFFIQYLDSL